MNFMPGDKKMRSRSEIAAKSTLALVAILGFSCEQSRAKEEPVGATASALEDVDIHDCAELQAMENDLAGSYRLAADIDCTSFDYGDGKGFLPIGRDAEEYSPFTGTLDGQGHVITGVTIARPYENAIGLIGAANGAMIRRVGLVDVTIEGHSAVGAIVGDGYATQLSESFATGAVTGNDQAGGLVGWVGPTSEVVNSYSSATITTPDQYTHGLVGGNVAGGLLSKTYSSGTTPDQSSWLGYDYPDGTVEASFFDCDVAGNCTENGAAQTAEMKLLQTYADAGWDVDDVWGFSSATSYPCLRWQAGCGCVAGRDSDQDGTPDCSDECAGDGTKTAPGVCGCGRPDVDSDGDGPLDCNDGCPNDPAKTAPGVCGCHDPDVDNDNDGSLNCQDPDSPIAIRNCSELQAMENNLAGSYRLVWDVDCTGFDHGEGKGFLPIGRNVEEEYLPFTGTFDGQGHVIKGVTILRPYENAIGLFGAANGATISRVGVVDVNIEGHSQVGAIAGDCNNSQLSESFATGSVTAWDETGGLAGWVGPTSVVENSYSSVTVTTPDYNTHGLVGGNLAGGTLTKTYSSGTVPSQSAWLGWDYPDGTVKASFFDCEVAGNCTEKGASQTAAMKQLMTYADAGWDVDGVWGFSSATSYPCLRWQPDCGCVAGRDSDQDGTADCSDQCSGDGTKTAPGACGCGHPDVDSDGDGALDCNDGCPDDPAKTAPGVCGCHDPDVDSDNDGSLNCQDPDWPVAIRNCTELQAMENDLEGSYRLVWDVDCAGFDHGDGKGFLPIGRNVEEYVPFTGTFDGQGHVITGLTISRPYDNASGLFGAANGATISRVGVVDANIEGHTDVGAIIGDGYNVQLSESFATGNVAGNNEVGGLIGYVGPGTSSIVENSYASVTVTTGDIHTHGLVGGSIDGGVLRKTYSSGTTPSQSAWLGYDYPNGTVQDSFFDCQLAGNCTEYGATQTADMKDEETFTDAGWDFDEIWSFSADNGYPCLRWQHNCGEQTCASTDTTCNGQDDDCDGTVDDNFVNQATSCGTGACARTGNTSCVAGSLHDSCSPGTPMSDANCNGIDDDCDGVADDDFISTSTSCGTGACVRIGSSNCVAGSVHDSCTPGSPTADNNCDGIDDDCDGTADDNYAPTATSCGTGACARTGSTSCVAGSVRDSCAPGSPSADTNCNGVDDDCDGSPDDNFASTTTSCGIGACASTGSTSCIAGSVHDSCAAGSPSVDTDCDGVDDDCDGSTDESYSGASTNCTVNGCAANGTRTCQAATVVDTCTTNPQCYAEVACADGIDNDGDGHSDCADSDCSTNAACIQGGGEICGNSLDDDADGLPDCADLDCDGLGPCVQVAPIAETVAPVLAARVDDGFGAEVGFLFSGEDPVQRGVTPGVIVPVRVAVVSGRVADASGAALQGVRVRVLHHDELGLTYTAADGTYVLAVNGGGPLTITLDKSGFLSAQRDVVAPWENYVDVPEVTLLEADSNVTTVTLTASSAQQVAQGSVSNDSDGVRQGTVVFPAGVEAQLLLPSGTHVPITSLSVRATEYTVGDAGPSAMPASLPPETAYTYAVDLSVDEAVAAGADSVLFSAPVSYYVDDFLDFPTGSAVPVGVYDKKLGRWNSESNGRVIKILSISSGRAVLDVTGSGQAATSAELTDIGITDAERDRLGALYAAGKELWRVQLSHFSIIDLNWPPPNVQYPDPGVQAQGDLTRSDDLHGPDSPPEQPTECGSRINCFGQSLGEDIPIAGTPLSLHYESRVASSSADPAFDIDFGGSDSPNLVKITVNVSIAGSNFEYPWPPGTQSMRFRWDGTDGLGREVSGSRLAYVKVCYRYQNEPYPAYYEPTVEGQRMKDEAWAVALWPAQNNPAGGASVSAQRTGPNGYTESCRGWNRWMRQARAGIDTDFVNGWNLSNHHRYDPERAVLHRGDGMDVSGTREAHYVFGAAKLSEATQNMQTGDPATTIYDTSRVSLPQNILAMDSSADGSVYVLPSVSMSVIRIDRTGSTAQWLDKENSNAPLDPSLQTAFNFLANYSNGNISPNAFDIAAAADGTVYALAHPSTGVNATIWRIDPNRVAAPVRIAGQTGSYGTGTYDDNVPALGAYLSPTQLRPHSGAIQLVRADTLTGTTNIVTTSGIAVGPDGSVYVADRGMVRRILPDGTLTTVVGNGPVTSVGMNPQNIPAAGSGATPVSARDVVFRQFSDIAVDSEGNLYIAAPVTTQSGTSFIASDRGSVYKVDPRGNIWLVAGSRNIANEPAAQLGEPIGADIGAWVLQTALDGRLLILGQPGSTPSRNQVHVLYNGRLARLTDSAIPATQAALQTAVYNGDWPPREGSSAFAIGSNSSQAMVARPDGSVWIATQSVAPFSFAQPSGWDPPAATRIFEVTASLPTTYALVPSSDGSEVYEFDAHGRQTRTLDPLNGSTRWQFFYQTDGRVSEVRDGDGRATVLSYSGDDVSITAPGGQQTTMARTSPTQSVVTTPDGQYGMTYVPGGGLMTGFARPNGAQSTYTYTTEGKLISDSRAGITGSKRLTPSGSPEDFRVDVQTPANRQRVYESKRIAGATQMTTTDTDGTKDTELYFDTQVQRRTAPDGTVTEVAYGPDSRFGFSTPFAKSTKVTLPSGKSVTTANTQQVTLTNKFDPFSVSSWTTTSTIGTTGLFWTSAYDGATRRITNTTPLGRVSTTTLDARGRVVRIEPGGLAPMVIDYDSNGRVSTLHHGDPGAERVTTFGYRTDGYLGTVTGPGTGEQMTLTPDGSGRPLSTQFANGNVISQTYDSESNPLSVTPPGRPAHALHYRSDGLLDFYDAPAPVSGGTALRTQYAYDSDGLADLLTLPDARTVDFQNNATTGVLEGIVSTGVTSAITHNATTGLVTRRTRTDQYGTSQLDFTYDGTFAKSATWSGAGSQGTVSYDYDTLLRLNTMKVGTSSATYTYDNDGLLLFYDGASSRVNFTRHPQNGLITRLATGSLAETYAYSRFAELNSIASLYSGTSYFSEAINSRDNAGRILTRTDVARTASGSGGTLVTTNLEYTYDTRGRLTEARKDGVLTSQYVLDDNGNRREHHTSLGTVIGRYDNQDRLTRYCPENSSGDPLPTTGLPCFEYTYNLAGQLATKHNLAQPSQTTTCTYDEQGALLHVALPDGRAIDYELDALGRRTGKRINGTRTKGFLYWDNLRPAQELAANQSVVSTFFYGSRANVPDVIVKGGFQYRLVTDHLGSVRLVVNTFNGQIAQRLEYDEFGNVLVDTSPGFQPFGFAGGLYDPDTGLVRFGARDYDAVTGRWTTKDPMLFDGGDSNLYAYAGSDSVNRIDPSGEFFFLIPFVMEGLALAAEGTAVAGTAAELAEVGTTAYQLWAASSMLDSWLHEANVNQAKARDLREGEDTRGKSLDEIREALKDRLTEGELKKKIQQVEKIRGKRNKQKRQSGHNKNRTFRSSPECE